MSCFLQVIRLQENIQGDSNRALAVNRDGKFVVLFATASTTDEGRTIAKELVSKKLVACVNIIPSVTSIYEWKGVTEESTEVLLIIKVGPKIVYSRFLKVHHRRDIS
jgi:uncharacterized protein involved in tolerance to divalent cations